jgi:pectate lyase
VSNAQDGAIDVTKSADWVTISWCKFLYAPKVPGSTHEFAHLIGSSDSDTAAGGVPFKVTLHHNWYGDNCVERMPSVRNGRVHVFNCYYTCAGNNYCTRTRIGSELLVENNFYLGVQNPWELLTTSGTTGKLKASGNNLTGPSDTSFGNTWVAGWYPGQSLIPGTDTLTDLNPPPYTYTNILDSAANVPSLIQSYAGSGKYPFAP